MAWMCEVHKSRWQKNKMISKMGKRNFYFYYDGKAAGISYCNCCEKMLKWASNL
jgi:hypothetical protein